MTQSSRVLATRCPHCHTVFRVVADQLKLRDGLVRCGHCREVFDGRAHLCDPPAEEKETPTDTAASAIGAVEPVSGTAAADRIGNGVTTGPISASSSPSSDAIPHATPLSSSLGVTPDETSSSPAFPSAQESVTPASPSAGEKPVPEMLTPTAIAALLGSPDESRARMQHGPGRYMDDDPTVLPAPTALPSPADASAAAVAKQNKDKRPGAARIVWRVLMALAVIGLLGQWAWLERAALVDRIPALHGAFAAVGRPIHVTIALPRQPDMIRISSVTLVTDEAGASQDADTASAPSAATGDTVPMTLTVFIRNQADYALAWPSLELTLSDIDGKPVVRRVFSANEYVTEATTRNAGLTPRNERTIRLRLSAQAALASNYRVLAFYP